MDGSTHPDRMMVANEVTEADPFDRGPQSPPDDFARDQSNVQRLFNMDDGSANAWLDSLTASEARLMLERLGSVTSEHERRARAASVLSDRIRQHFRVAADHAQPAVVGSLAGSPVRG